MPVVIETTNQPTMTSRISSAGHSSVWDQGSTGEVLSSFVTITVLPHGTEIPGSDFTLKYSILLEGERTPDGWLIRSGLVDEEAYGATF